jgi:hypothetical protein
MVRRLPVVSFKGKRWFLDERLKELRNVENPHEWVDLGELDLKELVVLEAGYEVR